MALLLHKRLLAGEPVVVQESPDPLETCPYEVRFGEGDKALLAKVSGQHEGELIKAAFLCMYQQLGATAPSLIQNDIKQKLLPRTGEVSAPERP